VNVVGRVYHHLDAVNKRIVIDEQPAREYESLAFDWDMVIIPLDGKLFGYSPFEV
jgi:hypothetical protein